MFRVQILDCPQISLTAVLSFVFSELTNSFSRDFQIPVQRIDSIDQIHCSQQTIVFLGDRRSDSFQITQLPIEPWYIGWYWWNVPLMDRFPRFIFTAENVVHFENAPIHNQLAEVFHRQHRFAPLLLRANEHPFSIGTYTRSPIRDYCYMGWGYLPDWEPKEEFRGFYHGVYDHSLFLPYEARKSIYLTSTFALGFQSPENVASGHVSQRIFEGLAYGCIVLTNSRPAEEQTEGCAIFVANQKDLVSKMKYYLQFPDKLQQQQAKGYEFVRRLGTNFHACQEFLKLIESA